MPNLKLRMSKIKEIGMIVVFNVVNANNIYVRWSFNDRVLDGKYIIQKMLLYEGYYKKKRTLLAYLLNKLQ